MKLFEKTIEPVTQEIVEKYDYEKGFNIVPEIDDYTLISNKRIPYATYWTPRLFKAVFILNLFSVICIGVAFIFYALRPHPEYYASTDRGYIEHLNKVK